MKKLEIAYASVNGHSKELVERDFIHYLPTRLNEAVEQKLDDKDTRLANRLDYFDFHYRRYLVGIHSTLHRVFAEVRSSIEDGLHEDHITVCIDEIESVILKNEFYELMPRLNLSRCRINSLIKQELGKYKLPF